jgi:hypothetical protein
VELLIRQLGKLSLDDPKYGLLYYRAIKLDTAVAQCVPPPVTARIAVRNDNNYRSSFPNPHHISNPPNQPQPLPLQTNASSMPPLDSRLPMICYGCGKTGHGIRNCSALQEMLQTGALMHDQSSRITFQDGSVVHCEQGETIIEAAHRHKGTQSHFFTLNQGEISKYYQSEVEGKDDDVADVLAAEHQPKMINKMRKETFDGVLTPPCKGKENV